jgi:hypothetical protein
MPAQKTADTFLKKLDLIEQGRIELVTPDGHSPHF